MEKIYLESGATKGDLKRALADMDLENISDDVPIYMTVNLDTSSIRMIEVRNNGIWFDEDFD